jgi:aminoglycoside 6'-N-acetyltransferase I
MSIEIRLLGRDDIAVFDHVAEDVFDHQVDPALAREFLADPRHHMVVAIEDGVIVGMGSAVDYIHPDKPRQLWINEMGVAPSHHRRGIGRQILDALLAHGRDMGCTEAWLGTELENEPARKLYESGGGKGETFVLYSFDYM